MDSKNEQNQHLLRMVETHKVKQRRPMKGDDSSQYECVFKYHVLLQDKRIQVCRDAFFGLYAASDKKNVTHKNEIKAIKMWDNYSPS